MGSAASQAMNVAELNRTHTVREPSLKEWLAEFNDAAWDANKLWVANLGAQLGRVMYCEKQLIAEFIEHKTKRRVVAEANEVTRYLRSVRPGVVSLRIKSLTQQTRDRTAGIYAHTYGDILLEVVCCAIGRLAIAHSYASEAVRKALTFVADRRCHAAVMHAFGFPVAWRAQTGVLTTWNDHTLSDHLEAHIYCMALRDEADLLYCVACFLFSVASCESLRA